MSAQTLTSKIDLAAVRLGGRVLQASDDFFAPKENLIASAEPVFKPDLYTEHGKWMDGWESRRKRTPGHDWCILQLGLRGVVRGVDVDTRFFTGNFPEACSIEACDLPGKPTTKRLGSSAAGWRALLPRRRLKGDAHNLFSVRAGAPATHLRLNIFPDGGVARLRVHGDVVPDWERVSAGGGAIDLAAVEHGGLLLDASDRHYGQLGNLIMPGRSVNMGDGWETRRRRGPGHDWAILRLGTPGELQRLTVETHHFKGNYPDTCWVEGCRVKGDSAAVLRRARWHEVLPRAKLRADARHVFGRKRLLTQGPFTHLRLNIDPDGGISRFRVHGHPE